MREGDETEEGPHDPGQPTCPLARRAHLPGIVSGLVPVGPKGRPLATEEEVVSTVPQRRNADQDHQDLDDGGQAPPSAFGPSSQLPQPHLDSIEKAGEGQEIAGEHPHPYDDDDVARARRG